MEFWVCETIVQLKKINKKPAIIRIANVPNYLSLHRICWVFFYNYKQIEIKSQN